MKIKIRTYARAFSMIELLITCSILACAIVPLISMLSEQHRGTANIVSAVTAANFAKDVIDYLKSLPYGQVDSSYNAFEVGGEVRAAFLARDATIPVPIGGPSTTGRGRRPSAWRFLT